MNTHTTDLSTRTRAAFSRARDFTHAKPHVAIAAGLGVVLAVAAGAGLAHHSSHAAPRIHARAAASVASTAAPSAPPAIAPAKHPEVPAPAAVLHHAASLPPSLGSAAVAPAATASTQPVALAAVAPAGLEPGRVRVTSYARDQFNGWAQTSQKVVRERALDVTSTARANSRTRWIAWVHTTRPTTVAVLRVSAGQAGVTADVDGQSLGATLDYYPSPRTPQATETAALALAPGWHEVTIIASRNKYAVGAGAAVEVALGDGTDEPTVPVPYAVTATAKASPKAPSNAPTKTTTSAGSAPAHPAKRTGAQS